MNSLLDNDFFLFFIYSIFAAILICPIWIPWVVDAIKKVREKNRKKKLLEYAKRNHMVVKPDFNKFFIDCGRMSCFSKILDPSFIDVIEILDKEKGDVYIGELQWELFFNLSGSKRRRHSYNKIKKAVTLCVLYDDGFKLPNFDLSRETLKDKTIELFGMNETEDIDFDNDKNFSEAWWLSSEENMIVRSLFTASIRSCFMRYVDKNYRICGQKKTVFIMTNGLIEPDNYSQVISDMRSIASCMRKNILFYSPSNK